MSHEITYEYRVDWNDDDDFDDLYEDITAYVKSAEWELGLKPDTLVADENKLTLTLNNEDQRFTPENPASPYYGQMEPKRKVRVRTTYKGTTRVMYLGWLDLIQVEGGDGRTATLDCVGPKQFLQDQQIRLALLENVRSDEVIQIILEHLMLPPALGGDNWLLGVPGNSELGETTYIADLSPALALDTGLMTFPYVADTWDQDFYGNQYVGEDWSGGFNGYNAIEDICRAERGRFFFNRDGKAVFWARDRLQTDIVLDATFDNLHFGSPEYAYGDMLANVIRVKVYPRLAGGGNEVLWTLPEAIELSPGEERTMQANYSEESSGVDISAIDALVTTFTHTGNKVTLDTEFQARGVRLTITNGNKFAKATVSALVIQGKRLTSWNEATVEKIDGLARAKNGPREYEIDSKVMSDLIFAQSLAEFELSRRKDALGIIHSISFQATEDSLTEQVLTRSMGDRIRIIDNQLMHDGEYFIVGEAHSVGLRDVHTVTWYLESGDLNRYWLLGTAGFSELGETTWLGL